MSKIRPGTGSVLTKRERQILQLLAEGRSRAQIATEMHICGSTITVDMRHVRTKLDVTGLRTAAAVSRALQHGLIVDNRSPATPGGSGPGRRLAPRERQMMAFLVAGLTVTQAAERMGVTRMATHAFIYRIYKKLGAHKRAEAVVVAVRLGIAPADIGSERPV